MLLHCYRRRLIYPYETKLISYLVVLVRMSPIVSSCLPADGSADFALFYFFVIDTLGLALQDVRRFLSLTRFDIPLYFGLITARLKKTRQTEDSKQCHIASV